MPEQIATMNVIYEKMWVYYNLFQPVLHLCEKTVAGDKVRRKWDQAQTPFERLEATGTLSAQQQQHLQALYEQTNPRQLRNEIHRLLTLLWEQALRHNQRKGARRGRKTSSGEGARRPCSRAGPPRPLAAG